MRFIALLLLIFVSAVSANPVRTDHLTATLQSSLTTIAPGATFDLALKLEHDAHWHSYWLNPGDTGLVTKLKLTLPPGFTAGELEFPPPERILVGDLVNFGYEGTIWLLTRVTAPTELPLNQNLEIQANASWLVCKEECIPGKATFALQLGTGSESQPSEASGEIATARAVLPALTRRDARFERTTSGYALTLTTAESAPPEVFPLTGQLVHNAAPAAAASENEVRYEFKQSEEFDALPESAEFLVIPDASAPYFVKAATNAVAAPIPAATTTAPRSSATGSASIGLLAALGLALMGGLILNLMPCVFPVLSLKALSFANLHGAERRTAVIDGIAYTAGVVVSFVALAGALLALRAAGEAIGWGFQLQSPLINGALAYLFFAMGLSLVGAVSFGSSIMGVGQSLTEGHGARAAFFTGVLACVVASPCTAPFMGTALGYAVTQPAPIALLVFATLGFGLALPMLLLSLVPRLSAMLPAPGAWMEVFKQLLAFPLFLTAIWLIWVVGRQNSVDAMSWLLIGAVGLAFALWLKDLQPTQTFSRVARASGLVIGLLLAAACLTVISQTPARAAAEASSESNSEPFSYARLEALRAANTPVLINMTADWCLTCKVNERLALASDAFNQALTQNGVVYMKGDWTHYDAEITKFLAQYGRNGVPLYVLFPATGEPSVLPQVLTPATIAEALGTVRNN